MTYRVSSGMLNPSIPKQSILTNFQQFKRSLKVISIDVIWQIT